MTELEWNQVLKQEADRMAGQQEIPGSCRCRWIEPTIGSTSRHHTYSCQVRVEPGSSYCPEHRAQVYESRAQRVEREAKRALLRAA